VDEAREVPLGAAGELGGSLAFVESWGLASHIVASRAALILGDVEAAETEVGEALSAAGAAAYLGVPIWTEGRAVGALAVYDRNPRSWTDEHLEVLQDLAETAGEILRARADALDDTDDLVNAEIVANSSEGIAIIDLQGNYVQQNDTHRQLIGYSDDELRGKTPAIHFGEEVFQSVAAELMRSGRYRGELVSRCKDGRLLDVELSAFAVYDRSGAPRYFVGIKRNITARKRAQRRQEELNAAERRAREDAESAVRARDEFLSIASHELRNPVAGIR
jgi:PAS domain S-box-containing protein